MGVEIELNIFITDLSDRLAGDRAIFTNGTKYFYQENAQLEGIHSKIFQGSLNR